MDADFTIIDLTPTDARVEVRAYGGTVRATMEKLAEFTIGFQDGFITVFVKKVNKRRATVLVNQKRYTLETFETVEVPFSHEPARS